MMLEQVGETGMKRLSPVLTSGNDVQVSEAAGRLVEEPEVVSFA